VVIAGFNTQDFYVLNLNALNIPVMAHVEEAEKICVRYGQKMYACGSLYTTGFLYYRKPIQ